MRPHFPKFLQPLLLLAFVSVATVAFAAPPPPPHDVWLEGESCQDHDFTTVGREAAFKDCYGGAILQLQTQQQAPEGGYHATFRPVLKEAGWWEVRLAVTKTGVTNLSPFYLQVGEYRSRRVNGFPVESQYGPGGIFAWVTAGRFWLPAGAVSITVRCREWRRAENDYLVYVDALALRRVEEPQSALRWIAGPEGASAWQFEKRFTVEAGLQRPLLAVVCEGRYEASLNGEAVGRGEGWETATQFPLAIKLRPGANDLALTVRPGDLGGVLAWLTVAGDHGSNSVVVCTDESWTVKAAAGGPRPARVLGGPHVAPWGDMEVQPVTRIPVGKLPIPLKTGNLSVDLLRAVAQGKPRPEPRAYPEFDDYQKLGGLLCVEDYICWLPLEPERDQLDWAFYERNCQELEAREMKYAVYPWLHFAPEWVTKSELWEPLLCLRHGEPTWAPSIWSPKTVQLFDRFYGQLREHFGDRVREVFVSMVCDYGEVGYPAGLADWVVHSDHVHPDYWCGDPLARADFRAKAIAKYAGLAGVNAAWGTGFANVEAIDYPQWTAEAGPDFDTLEALPPEQRTQARRRWLDFAEWYLNAMVDFAGKAVGASRRHFPDAPHEIKIGFGQEPVKLGADYTAFVARSRQDQYTVRSTHGKLPLYFYRRFSSAAKHYGVPLVTEPPSTVSRDEEVERIFKDATSGTAEYFDYPNNLLGATDLFARFGRYLEGKHSLTDVAFFFPTTDHRLRAGQGNPEHLLAACGIARDLFDWDLVDERLVRDGALSRYGVLLLVEGNVIERDVLERLEQWVSKGGFVASASFGAIETVEGDLSWNRRVLVDAASIPAVAEAWPAHGEPAAACLVDVGSPEDGPALAGDWNNCESGHWEWGGAPGKITKRWSGAHSSVCLPVDPVKTYNLAIAVARHPGRLSTRAEVLANGNPVGSLSHTRTSIFRARVAPAQLRGQALLTVELDVDTFCPADNGESPDRRTLGVGVDWVKLWLAGQPEPQAAPAPTLRRELDTSLLTARCVRRLGEGATLLSPFGWEQLPAFVALAEQVAHAPQEFMPGRKGAPLLDGQRDGVWTALMANRVLLYNSTDHEVAKTVALDPDAVQRAGAAPPVRGGKVEVNLGPRSLASIELPQVRVVAP